MFKIAHNVICVYCKQRFDRDKDPFVAVSSRRYAHKECYDKAMAAMSQDEKDKIILEKYIKELFNTTTISQKIQRQINSYIKDNGYTYSGIYKTLKYFYGVKNNSIEKANGGIGIVPYVYQDAYNYFYDIWVTNQDNKKRMITNDYIPEVLEVHIKAPERKSRVKPRFNFLDDEVDK